MTHRIRTLASALVASSVLLVATPTQATPSEAAALGGLDLHFPAQLDTFHFFDTDVNIYTNPALAHWYTNQAQINLGVRSGGPFPGVALNPHGFILFAPSDTITLGAGVNRSYREFGEQNAVRNVLGRLLSAGNGSFGGTVVTPPGSAALPSGQIAPLMPPLDIFFAVGPGDVMIGLNVLMAFGSGNTDNMRQAGVDPDPNDQFWTRTRETARSSYISATAGFLFDNGGLVRPEVWLRYTNINAWNDQQVWGATEGADWTDTDTLAVDQTVGLRGTSRFGGGVRGTFYLDATEITPVVTVDSAQGRFFGDYNLNNDTDVDVVARSEDDLFRVSSLDIMAGVGVTWHPFDEMRIIASASAHISRVTTVFNNFASENDELHVSFVTNETFWNVPMLSIGAEYFPTKVFGIRGSVRGSAVLSRMNMDRQDFSGDPAGIGDNGDDDEFETAIQTTLLRSGADFGNPVPNLAAAIGPTLQFEHASLEAVFGGLIVGANDTSFFSRLDLKVDWN